jgi:hypothetical protein
MHPKPSFQAVPIVFGEGLAKKAGVRFKVGGETVFGGVAGMGTEIVLARHFVGTSLQNAKPEAW